MKSDIDIQDDVFHYLQNNQYFWSDMAEYGILPTSLVRDTRKEGEENVVISILANGGDVEEIQESFVNVNVFVKDLEDTKETQGAGVVTEYYPNIKKLRGICQVMADYLFGYGDTFRFEINEQRVLADEATHTHFVNTKLLYKSINL